MILETKSVKPIEKLEELYSFYFYIIFTINLYAPCGARIGTNMNYGNTFGKSFIEKAKEEK